MEDYFHITLTPMQAFGLVMSVWIVAATVVGMGVFNTYPAPEKQATAFLDALATNPKAGTYYLNTAALGQLSPSLKIIAQTDSATLTRCYTTDGGLRQVPSCQSGMEVSLDRHAVGTLLAASFDARERCCRNS